MIFIVGQTEQVSEKTKLLQQIGQVSRRLNECPIEFLCFDLVFLRTKTSFWWK